jgi:hypothetical protein
METTVYGVGCYTFDQVGLYYTDAHHQWWSTGSGEYSSGHNSSPYFTRN